MTRGTKTIIAGIAVCLCAGWAIPHFIRTKSTKPDYCINKLRIIESAKEDWAMEHNETNGADVTWDDLRDYGLGPGPSSREIPICPDGGVYIIGKIGEKPRCSIGGVAHTLPDKPN
jgi:hypothetical protein